MDNGSEQIINNNGEMTMELCMKNNLAITNSYFKPKEFQN